MKPGVHEAEAEDNSYEAEVRHYEAEASNIIHAFNA